MAIGEGIQNQGLFPESEVLKRNAIIVAAGNGVPIELQTVDIVPETYTLYENDVERTIEGERLVLRTGESLIPAAYTDDSEDDSLVNFANAYESIPDSLVGPLLRTKELGDEVRFQELVGPFTETEEARRAREDAERQEAALLYRPRIKDWHPHIGVRGWHDDYWLRLEPGPSAEPHALGKTTAARVAFFLWDVQLGGAVPIIHDESGNNGIHYPPTQFILPNPWLYVVRFEGDPDDPDNPYYLD